MTKITPHLWYDDQAEEAAEFYCEIFEDGEIRNTTPYYADTPSEKPIGSTMTVDFEIEGQRFIALNGGPLFKFNPSISFMVYCKSIDKINGLWESLSKDGKVLMPINKYPFNDRFGWLEDKYGVSWQLLLAEPSSIDQVIVPKIMYVGDVNGKAEEAVNHYVSVFNQSEIEYVTRYGENPRGSDPDHISQAIFWIEDMKFAAMDGGTQHEFNFNEAISFVIECDDQEDIDYYWENLSEDPSGGQCGWQKDKFGVSWQIIPQNMNEILNRENDEKAQEVMKSFLEMKKIDIATLNEIIVSQQ